MCTCGIVEVFSRTQLFGCRAARWTSGGETDGCASGTEASFIGVPASREGLLAQTLFTHAVPGQSASTRQTK
jgi:hypothetical protein